MLQTTIEKHSDKEWVDEMERKIKELKFKRLPKNDEEENEIG